MQIEVITLVNIKNTQVLEIHMQNNEFGPLIQTIYKKNSKWIKDQNVRTNTVNKTLKIKRRCES